MSYPSDVTDAQWSKIEDFFKCGNYGNRALHDKKTLVNAVLYITKTGCQWRQLPKDFPPWKTVYTFFRRVKKRNLWDKIMHSLVAQSRLKSGRGETPSYALIDSQSAKTVGLAEERGFDGGYRGTTLEFMKNVLNNKRRMGSYTHKMGCRKNICVVDSKPQVGKRF